MQKRSLYILCVGLIWGCVVPIAAHAQEDANEPWDPAAHLTAVWESVELSARLTNPVEKPDQDPNTQRQLTVAGAIKIIDKTSLVGVDSSPRNVVVLDQDGTERVRALDRVSDTRWYRSLEHARRLVGPNQWADEIPYVLNIPVDPNGGYPSSLSLASWSIRVLLAEEFKVVDIPFESNDTWVEPVDGLEILVEEALVEEGKYTYRVQAVYDPEAVSYTTSSSWHFRRDETPPAVLLLKTDVLNADGHSVHDVSSGGGRGSGTTAHESDGLMIATTTASGSCSACGAAATIRYTFALDPYELEVPFTLADIPVPSF